MSETTDKPDWTVAEIAARHKLSRQTITAMFENERGVIILDCPTMMRKRRHRTIRIPDAVYRRKFGTITKAMRERSSRLARGCRIGGRETAT
jgi:hypothetical protein